MSSAQQPPIYLTILRRGDTNIVDLAEVGSIIPRSETLVESSLLQELADEVMNLATPGNGRLSQEPTTLHNPDTPDAPHTPDTLLQDLKRIGELIFSHLLTEPARNRLRTSEPCDLYLRLDEQLIHVPWELCYDGHDFLATKFRVGRQIITDYAVPGTTATRTLTQPFKVLLIADPTETLPQAEIEAQQLRSLLEGVEGIELTQFSGKSVRKVPLLSALQHHDIVHFAGHSHYDANNPTKSGWRLAEGILTAGELSKLTTPPLLVFSNSCQAGTTAEWDGPRYEGQAFGIGSAFLLAGVKNYIGTFWVVHDDESARFAAVYYQNMARGHSLGMALQQARHIALEEYGGQSLTWASYMLYGDPGFPLLPQSENVAEIPALPAGAASATGAASAASVASAASTPSATRSSVSSFPPFSSSAQDTEQVSRRLAAILMADVQGYSRLMGEDEEATVRTLTAFRAVFADLIQRQHGRIVDAPGDAVLAEFVSVVDSVRCAVAIQHELTRRNASLPLQRRMIFRIGLNLGDIIAKGHEIYGDGINIAARLEPLADGGGVCISGTVFDQVETKLEFTYEDLGPQKVKNIARPVRAYKIIFDPAPESTASQPAIEPSQSQPKQHTPTLQSGVQSSASAAPAALSQRPAAAQQTRTSSGNSTPLIVGAGIVLVLIGLYFWSSSSTPPEQAGQEIASSEQALTAIETSAVIPLGSLTYSRHLSTPTLTIHLSAAHIEQAFLNEVAVPISEEGLIQHDFQQLPLEESTHTLHLVGQSDEQVHEQVHDVALTLRYYPNWEIRRFSEGVGLISAMALSPDGTQILSENRNNMVKLRDTKTGAELRTFTGHTGWVNSVAFSSDGTKILSGSRDQAIKLWDTKTGAELRTFTGHTGWINSVAFSPDGTKILSGSDDKTLKLWDVETGQDLQTFTGHTDGVNSVAFSRDGSHILSGGKDKRLRWWNIESGKTEKTLSGHGDWVIHVTVSPDGTQALSSSDDKTLRLWDIQTGRTIRTLSGHTDLVNGVAFSPDGKQALSSSNDKTLKLWNIETGGEIQTFSGHSAGVRTTAFSSDGTTILSSGQDQTIREWWVAPSSQRTVEVQLIEVVAQPAEKPPASSPPAS